MLKLVEMECPNCGGAMDRTSNDTARCPHCEMSFMIDKGQPKELHIHQPESKSSWPVLIFIGIVLILAVLTFGVFRSNSDTTETTVVQEKRPRFESDLFEAFVEEVYHMDAEEVPEEQLKELTQIHIERERGRVVVNYRRGQGEVCEIQLEDAYRTPTMEDLKYFPNLESIEVDYYNIPAQALEKLTALKYLASGTTPEELNLSRLQEFTLRDTIVLEISALENNTELKKVCLVDNHEITDYSPLSSLGKLEELELELGSDAEMPDVSGWGNLQTLSIKGASDMSFLKSLPTLKSLHLWKTDSNALEAVSTLKNLEHLEFESIFGDFTNPEVLAKLPKLKTLDMSDITIYGNMEAVFGIPSLESLNVSDCSFGMNFDAMTENPGLKFPNLEELHLQGNKLTEVTFAEDLSELKSLDITDNYVTDLRPLKDLAHLEIVWCGENAIAQGLDLGENVIVIPSQTSEGNLI